MECDVFVSSLSFQHTLTSTADLILQRLTQRVAALTVASDVESVKAQCAEETDRLTNTEDCDTLTPSN